MKISYGKLALILLIGFVLWLFHKKTPRAGFVPSEHKVAMQQDSEVGVAPLEASIETDQTETELNKFGLSLTNSVGFVVK